MIVSRDFDSDFIFASEILRCSFDFFGMIELTLACWLIEFKLMTILIELIIFQMI